MCLAIPSQITKIENEMATIDVDGVQREASLLLLADAQVGDYVIVHAGFAIQKLDEAAAKGAPAEPAQAIARGGHDFGDDRLVAPAEAGARVQHAPE